MTLPAENIMREAVATRDKTFEGRFLYGVITTGIFCRPSCTSRPALPEHLRFFPDVDSAIAAGFRPCKRCKPGEPSPGLSKLVAVARYIEAHVEDKLTLTGLAARASLSPSRFQRRFKEAFGVSPKAYQDALRMERFKSALKAGDDVTGAVFSAGFGSLSRVYGEKARNIGMSPKAYRAGGAGESIAYACRITALGPVMMAATDRGVCFVQFGVSENALLQQLRNEFPKAELLASAARSAPELDHWIEALDRHLSQGAPRPDLPLDLRGTAFQMKVWKFLLGMSEGEALSYGEVAVGIDQPTAARAVASACASNRVGVLVPCHRVLRGDGSLGGYRWGAERKRALLDLERSGKGRGG